MPKFDPVLSAHMVKSFQAVIDEATPARRSVQVPAAPCPRAAGSNSRRLVQVPTGSCPATPVRVVVPVATPVPAPVRVVVPVAPSVPVAHVRRNPSQRDFEMKYQDAEPAKKPPTSNYLEGDDLDAFIASTKLPTSTQVRAATHVAASPTSAALPRTSKPVPKPQSSSPGNYVNGNDRNSNILEVVVDTADDGRHVFTLNEKWWRRINTAVKKPTENGHTMQDLVTVHDALKYINERTDPMDPDRRLVEGAIRATLSCKLQVRSGLPKGIPIGRAFLG